jgi:hypothetical protein
MSRFNREHACKYLPWALAVALFITFDAAHGQSDRGGQAKSSPTPGFPKRGAVYVDVITDKTGAVERLDFLNNVPAEIQKWIREKTLGHHFGVPNHSYRRHIQYEVDEPPEKRR